MYILFVEPHGDDALISASRLLRSEKDVIIDILTLSARRSDNLKQFFKTVRDTRFLNLTDYHWDNRPMSHHDVNSLAKRGLNTFESYMNVLRDEETFQTAVSDVKDAILQESEHYDLYLCPLGVVHPYHCAVREAFNQLVNEEVIDLSNLIYYSEAPYNHKKYGLKLQEDAIELLGKNNGHATWFSADPAWIDTKEKIYRRVYPTEVSLFRFSYDHVIKNTETFIGKSKAIHKLKGVLYYD